MSYLVLARRWRPQKFSELIGQPHVARTMLNGLRQNRVAHAYLFSGPRGVGKTTTARLVAKAINCTNLRDGEPCGVCDSCLAVVESRAIDVIEIDAASNRGIDEIRLLRDSVRYAPIEGSAKVYIIDEVHMLTPEAFNALLKTLEEPPDHAYFCLATTAPQKVPSTILSRCQRFDFRRVPLTDIYAHLENICQADEFEFEPEALEIIARRADGSVRDSLSLLDQVIAFGDGKVLAADAGEVAGEIRLDLFFRAVDLVESGAVAAAFELDRDLASEGIDLQDFIAGLQNHLVQILQAKSLGADAIEAPQEYVDRYAAAADQLDEEDLVRLLQFCATAEVDIRRNYTPRTRIQLLLLKFATFERSVVIGDLLTALRGDGANTPGKPSQKVTPTLKPKPAATPPKPSSEKVEDKVSPPPDDPTPEAKSDPPSETEQPTETHGSEAEQLKAVQSAWDDICVQVSRKHNSSGHIIKYAGYPSSLKGGVLTINFRKQVHLDTAQSCIETLRQEAAKVAGEVRLEFQIGDVPPRPEGEHPEEDEAVRLLQDKLGAKLID